VTGTRMPPCRDLPDLVVDAAKLRQISVSDVEDDAAHQRGVSRTVS
jgi:hypothetical protein